MPSSHAASLSAPLSPTLWSHHCHQNPTLKVQFALRALQKDGTHRVQIVIAVTAQRPSACLCDLEGTSRVADMRQTPLSGTDSAESAPSRAKPTERSPALSHQPLPKHPACAKDHAWLPPSRWQASRSIKHTDWNQNARFYLWYSLHTVTLSIAWTKKWKQYSSIFPKHGLWTQENQCEILAAPFICSVT